MYKPQFFTYIMSIIGPQHIEIAMITNYATTEELFFYCLKGNRGTEFYFLFIYSTPYLLTYIVHTKLRNHLGVERAAKLVFCYRILRGNIAGTNSKPEKAFLSIYRNRNRSREFYCHLLFATVVQACCN